MTYDARDYDYDPVTGEDNPKILLPKECFERGQLVFFHRNIELPRENYPRDETVQSSTPGETLDPGLFPSGLRTTDQFTNWSDAEGVRDLESVSPGCPDSELETVRDA